MSLSVVLLVNYDLADLIGQFIFASIILPNYCVAQLRVPDKRSRQGDTPT